MKKNKKETKVAFNQRCLISCDLDGTLLNNKGVISEFSKKVIAKLINKGHVFCINTARPYNSAAKFYQELNLNTPIVCHNGAYLFSPYECDFISSNFCLSHLILKELLTDSKIMELTDNALIDAEKTSYVWKKADFSPKQISAMLNALGIYTTEDVRKLDGSLDNFDDTAFGIIFRAKKDEQIMELINAIKIKVPTVITTIWKIGEKVGSVVKVNCAYCSKGVALQLLSNYFGIPEFRCFAFGDGRDDSDMLKFASHGYAMRNGTDDAQLRANFVTEWTNDNDGVARTLNKDLKLGFRYK